MAYAPLPKLVPIGSPRVAPDEVSKVMYPDLLHSEPVQRLLNQPNIVIKPINIPEEDSTPKPTRARSKSSKERRPRPDITMSLVDLNPEDLLRPLKPPKCPLEPLEPPESPLESSTNFPSPLKTLYLPSKIVGDSGISLHPIINRRRKCGHCEPCESIICDVNVQQYVDTTGSSPLIATTITDSEITAPVSKHCSNPRCDALSIDHNRCRRLKLELKRCDKSNACDICGVVLKNRKTRIHHKNCKRRTEYRHNQVDGAQILKERMREREIQMMEALRMKRNDHVESSIANDRAAESLKKNSELIVIPRAPVQGFNQSFIRMNSISNPSAPPIAPVLHNIPLVLQPQAQRLIINNQNFILPSSDKNHIYIPNNSITNSETGKFKSGNSQENKFVVPPVQPRAIAYPLNVNEWLVQQGTPVAPKPVMMPITVVPIANLKSEPSMLHRKEGIPRFCIIANNTIQMQSFVNVQTVPTIQPVSGVSSNTGKSVFIKPNPVMPIRPAPAKQAVGKAEEKLKKITPRRRMKYKRRKKGEKKPFECTYCSKRFLTDWYFKVHVAKHKGEKVKCEICETVCKSDSDLKKHVSSEHRGKVEVKVEAVEEDEGAEGEQETGDEQVVCENCETSFETTLDMENHSCLDVNGMFSDVEIKYEEVVEDEEEGFEALEEGVDEERVEEGGEEDDGIVGYEGLEEIEDMEETEQLEEELNGEDISLSFEEVNGRVNGVVEEDCRKARRRKTWHSTGGDDEIYEKADFNCRERQTIHR
ncbi:uncharacterized protein LOC107042955 isoform X2 [Diachasma alloeum]|uniref:uncharacterized protein LOC107042955 isoform X2 n=1 Tax=Diachasma alloeum TaxID=454923 RepID=UPI0007383A2D|nr:uncharacterized protein LOC107042955 isoform X2 [Diachasma alloeum]